MQETNGIGNEHVNKKINYTMDDDSTLTDTRDIRETEINFLNNNLTRDLDSKNLESLGCHLTRVNVTVPGATKTTDTVRYNDAGYKKSAGSGRSQDVLSKSLEIDGRMSEMSNSDGESVQNKKLKAIKNIDPGTFFLENSFFLCTYSEGRVNTVKFLGVVDNVFKRYM